MPKAYRHGCPPERALRQSIMIFVRRVIGKSMLPTYQPGTVLFGWRRKELKVGDIVIAKHKEMEIVKRIARIEEAGYFLEGDNPKQSSDSRTYGIFSRQAIKGVVMGAFGNDPS